MNLFETGNEVADRLKGEISELDEKIDLISQNISNTLQLRIPFVSYDVNPENEFDIIDGDTDRIEKMHAIDSIIEGLEDRAGHLLNLKDNISQQIFDDTEENTARNLEKSSNYILSIVDEIKYKIEDLEEIKESIKNYREEKGGSVDFSEYGLSSGQVPETISLNKLSKYLKSSYEILSEVNMPERIPIWYGSFISDNGIVFNNESAIYIAFSGYPTGDKSSINNIMTLSNKIDELDKSIDRVFLKYQNFFLKAQKKKLEGDIGKNIEIGESFSYNAGKSFDKDNAYLNSILSDQKIKIKNRVSLVINSEGILKLSEAAKLCEKISSYNDLDLNNQSSITAEDLYEKLNSSYNNIDSSSDKIKGYIDQKIIIIDFIIEKLSEAEVDNTSYDKYFDKELYDRDSIFRSIQKIDFIFSADEGNRRYLSKLENQAMPINIGQTLSQINKYFKNVMEGEVYVSRERKSDRPIHKILKNLQRDSLPVDDLDKIILGVNEEILLASKEEEISDGDTLVRSSIKGVWKKAEEGDFDEDGNYHTGDLYATVLEEIGEKDERYKEYRCNLNMSKSVINGENYYFSDKTLNKGMFVDLKHLRNANNSMNESYDRDIFLYSDTINEIINKLNKNLKIFNSMRKTTNKIKKEFSNKNILQKEETLKKIIGDYFKNKILENYEKDFEKIDRVIYKLEPEFSSFTYKDGTPIVSKIILTKNEVIFEDFKKMLTYIPSSLAKLCLEESKYIEFLIEKILPYSGKNIGEAQRDAIRDGNKINITSLKSDFESETSEYSRRSFISNYMKKYMTERASAKGSHGTFGDERMSLDSYSDNRISLTQSAISLISTSIEYGGVGEKILSLKDINEMRKSITETEKFNLLEKDFSSNSAMISAIESIDLGYSFNIVGKSGDIINDEVKKESPALYENLDKLKYSIRINGSLNMKNIFNLFQKSFRSHYSKIGVDERIQKYLESAYNDQGNVKYLDLIRLVGSSSSSYHSLTDKSSDVFASFMCISFISNALNVSIENAITIFINNQTDAFVYEISNFAKSKDKLKNIEECFGLHKNKIKLKDKVEILFKYFEKSHSSSNYGTNHCKNIISILSTPYSSGIHKSKIKQEIMDTVIDLSFVDEKAYTKEYIEEKVKSLSDSNINIDEDIYNNFIFLLEAKRFSKNIFKKNKAMSKEDFLKIKKALAEVKYFSSLMSISYSNMEFIESTKDNEKKSNLFELNYDVVPGQLRFRVLEKGDGYGLRAGIDTNCCQYLGGAASSIVYDYIGNPSASILILEFKPKENFNYFTRSGESLPAKTKDGYHIVSQSIVHYQEKEFNLEINQKNKIYEKFFILDNIESAFVSVDFFEEHYGIKYIDVYRKLSKKIERKGYGSLIIGSSFTKFFDESIRGSSSELDPRSFVYSSQRGGIYSDFKASNFMVLDSEEIKKESRFKSLRRIYVGNRF